MNESCFLRTSFHSALAILEPQINIVVEQFGAGNISLLSGRLVLSKNATKQRASHDMRNVPLRNRRGKDGKQLKI